MAGVADRFGWRLTPIDSENENDSISRSALQVRGAIEVQLLRAGPKAQVSGAALAIGPGLTLEALEFTSVPTRIPERGNIAGDNTHEAPEPVLSR